MKLLNYLCLYLTFYCKVLQCISITVTFILNQGHRIFRYQNLMPSFLSKWWNMTIVWTDKSDGHQTCFESSQFFSPKVNSICFFGECTFLSKNKLAFWCMGKDLFYTLYRDYACCCTLVRLIPVLVILAVVLDHRCAWLWQVWFDSAGLPTKKLADAQVSTALRKMLNRDIGDGRAISCRHLDGHHQERGNEAAQWVHGGEQ